MTRHSFLACVGGLFALAVALAGPAAGQQPGAAGSIAAVNDAIRAQIASTTAALSEARAEITATEKARGDLEVSLQELERRAEVHAIGKEFARSLVHELQALPRPERSAFERDQRRDLITATSDANLHAEQMRRQLVDLDTSVERSLAALAPPPSPEQRPQVAAELRIALAEQRALLGQLDGEQLELMKALRKLDETNAQLDRQVKAARQKLTQILYWIPAPASLQTLQELGPSLAWTVSPAHWRSAAADLHKGIAREPLRTAAAVLAALLLVAGRPLFRRGLVSMAPATIGFSRFGLRHALSALACTAALALPGPLVLWTVATLLAPPPVSEPFAHALADALHGIARLLLALSALAWLLDRRGMAVNFFGGDADALGFAASAVRRFALLFVPLLAVAALNGLDFAPWSNRESLARVLLVVALVALAGLLAHLLRRSSPLMRPLIRRAPRSLAVGTHWLWASALVALPLAIAGLAVAGYFVVAGYLLDRVLLSLFIVLAAIALYGLMALWVQVARFRLDLQREGQLGNRNVASGTGTAELRPQRIDLTTLGEQTGSLLDLLVTALLIAALWLVWRAALPNLDVVADYPLWTVTDKIGGREVVRPLTIGGVMLALLVAALTVIVVRKIGALLDIALLQRFDLQADATYAIKVIARYAVAAVGVIAVARILSIEWSDAQWLVAALGVGLGFGLQEIVANFISGLIVLTERPIRVGDVVTVGDITGTVTAIQARSTRIIDFDRKEVIIPNKAFITERVTNWTLSDRTTRLQLKVSVAYGSDLARVRSLMLEALRANPDVLQVPPPAALMMGFGDSSIDFELFAYVDAMDKRLRVRDELYRDIERVLRENGIAIPFPQRDLHIRSAAGLADSLPRSKEN